MIAPQHNSRYATGMTLALPVRGKLTVRDENGCLLERHTRSEPFTRKDVMAARKELKLSYPSKRFTVRCERTPA
jgi:hypothetical protein